MLRLALSHEFSLRVDREEILRYLGGKKGASLPDRIGKVVEEMAEYGPTLVEPRFVFDILPVTELDFDSPCIGDLCRKGEWAAVVVSTIGQRLEQEAAAFFSRREYLKSVVLDAVGSVLAECLTDDIARDLADQCRTLGLRNSMRMSPGYGDWDVTEQKKIFRLVDASAIEVHLNDSCLMTPLKSVSFLSVIGAGLPEVYMHHRKCDFCKSESCKFRSSSR